LYKKVLLAYDGSIEGRRALREGAKLAQFCGAEVFLVAVVEISSGSITLEGGFAIPVEEQIATYKAILAEGVERLRAIGFSPTRGWVWELPDRRSLGSPKRSEQTS
jgi:nucleotide-binding universal stress UspA family protein